MTTTTTQKLDMTSSSYDLKRDDAKKPFCEEAQKNA